MALKATGHQSLGFYFTLPIKKSFSVKILFHMYIYIYTFNVYLASNMFAVTVYHYSVFTVWTDKLLYRTQGLNIHSTFMACPDTVIELNH